MIYRGHEIVQHGHTDYRWTDERGFAHGKSPDGGLPGQDLRSEDEAMNSIDQYKRNMASLQRA